MVEIETVPLTEKKLEEQISKERHRLSTDRMDISFGELINMYINKELIIRPEYQRLYRWSDEQKTALIESILLSIPIPPIFVSEDEDGIWELIDGLQRVSTIVSFFGKLEDDLSKVTLKTIQNEDEDGEIEEEAPKALGNNWKLLRGSLIPALKDFDNKTLPTKYLINIKRSVCRVEIVRGESNVDMKYEIFKRLNSGGSKAKPQEIRNAIYRSANSNFYNLLLELSNNSTFKRLTNLSKSKLLELYDQELILKFVAFLGNVSSINDNTENYLNDFMEKAIVNSDFPIYKYKEKFLSVMNKLEELDDDRIFRSKGNLFIPSEYEGITVALAQNFSKYENNIDLIREKINELKSDEEFKRFSGTASNSKTRIKKRLERANEIFSYVE